MERLIICLIGKSGCGKSTIAKYLNKYYDFINVETYASRARRYKNESGHIFLNMDYNNLIDIFNGLNGEDLVYKSCFDDTLYWAYKSQIDLHDKCVIALNQKAANQIRLQLRDIKTLIVYIECRDEIRKTRMIKRLRHNNIVDEILIDKMIKKRMDSDEIEYKDSNIYYEYKINNNNEISSTLQQVESIVEKISLRSDNRK